MIDDLPDNPDPAIDPPKTFSDKAAAFALALKKMVVQLRSAIASIGIIAGGSANKIPYRIDLNSQAVGDPGSGWLRLNNAVQASATALLLDVIGNDLVDYTGLIGTFSASTSAVLGQVRIEKQADASRFLVFNLTAVATPAGYRQLTVTNFQASGPNPFVHGDPVVLSFSRNGDKGDRGMNSGFTPYPVAASDIDLSKGDGYFTKTVAGNTTFTISNCPAGGFSFTLEIAHTAGSIAFPASAKMIGNIAPALVTGKTHLFMFVTSNGGARWRVTSLANFDT